jgi:hypothetical protein
VDVSIKHVADELNAGPPVTDNPPTPVRVVNVALVPGATRACPDVATGAGGGLTLGVIVATDFWPIESAIAY